MVRFALSSLVFALALGTPAPGEDAKKDAADSSLPKGAKFRVGSRCLPVDSFVGPPLYLFGPDYKTLGLYNAGAGPNSERFLRLEVATGKPLSKASERPFVPDFAVPQVVVSADGKRAAQKDNGRLLSVFEAESGKPVRQYEVVIAPGATGPEGLALSADGEFVALGFTVPQKSQVNVWDVRKDKPVLSTELALRGTVAVALSPDGKLLAVRGGVPPTPPMTTSEKIEIQVWDVGAQKELFKGTPTSSGYNVAMTFSPDGAMLAVSFGNGVIDLWDVRTGKQQEPLLARTAQGRRLAVSPDSKMLAAVSTSGAIERWALPGGNRLGATESPLDRPDQTFTVHGIAFADNERVVGWARHGSMPLVWEAPSGKLVTAQPKHTGKLSGVAFAAGGKELLTAGAADGRLFRWDAATGKPLGRVPLRQPVVVNIPPVLTLDPSGTWVTMHNSTPALFDSATGREELALPTPPGYNVLAVPSADPKRAGVLVWGNPARPGRCMIWDTDARRKVLDVELIGFGSPPASATISPSGERLLVCFRPSGAKVTSIGWDLKTGKQLGTVRDDVPGSGLSKAVAFDDTTAVVRDPNGRLRVLDYETGKFGVDIEEGSKKDDRSWEGAVVFGPDRKRLAAALPASEGQWAYGVRVYEWPSGKPLHTFHGHTGTVTALAFSPDGKTLATGSADATAIVWDLPAEK